MVIKLFIFYFKTSPCSKKRIVELKKTINIYRSSLILYNNKKNYFKIEVPAVEPWLAN